LNGSLLSRVQVYVLTPLTVPTITALVERALTDGERGLGHLELEVAPGTIELLAEQSDGDARRALTVLEAAARLVGPHGTLTPELIVQALGRRVPAYDKNREEHYNMLSAYHKALRGSDPQGALYWMARMLEGGEDPMTLFRRAIAMAAEDVGLADPEALKLAVAARDAFHMLGAPEGYLPLAEMTIYLATAPKSNRTMVALSAALEAARRTPAEPVPLHIRNAPTSLMKNLGYGGGYQYAHDSPTAYTPQEYLPPSLAGQAFYVPGEMGFEKRIRERLEWWEKQKGGRSEVKGEGEE
jgi:putative ATPase